MVLTQKVAMLSIASCIKKPIYFTIFLNFTHNRPKCLRIYLIYKTTNKMFQYYFMHLIFHVKNNGTKNKRNS